MRIVEDGSDCFQDDRRTRFANRLLNLYPKERQMLPLASVGA
jgi:hypothetical protein